MDLYVYSNMALNFTPNFIELIRILPNSPKFRVMNNGISVKTCRMTRELRQGCPISALLLSLTVEILPLRIKRYTWYKIWKR